MAIHIGLKPFTDAIATACTALPQERLVEVITALARETPPEERVLFLAKLKGIIAGEKPEGKAAGKKADSEASRCLDAIATLREEIFERISSIEDGTYWNDPDEDMDFDDQPDEVSDEQSQDLAGYFTEANHLFLNGAASAALALYTALFDLLDEIQRHTYMSASGLAVDLREARARYCRLVLNAATAGERVPQLLAAMKVSASKEDGCDKFATHDLPMLRDVRDADAGEIQGFEDFLVKWSAALDREDSGNARVAGLLLEAVFLQTGLSAVMDLARKWKAAQPLGYLFWLDRLEAAADWPGLRDASGEALTSLPPGEPRAEAASRLTTAGRKLEDATLVLEGIREQFRSTPSDNNLLELVTEAERQGVRDAELAKACDYLDHPAEQKSNGGVLLAKALLMAGRVDEAVQLCKASGALGWSYSANPVGLIFGSVLHLTSGGSPECVLIANMLREHAERSVSLYGAWEEARRKNGSFFLEISRGLAEAAVSTTGRERYREWAFAIGKKRVEGIVTNKHRNAYGRAANVLGCLAESLLTAGRKAEAHGLVHEYCKVRFNRHSAFKSEVRNALLASPMLKPLAMEV